jgi:hypothetical protein
MVTVLFFNGLQKMGLRKPLKTYYDGRARKNRIGIGAEG